MQLRGACSEMEELTRLAVLYGALSTVLDNCTQSEAAVAGK